MVYPIAREILSILEAIYYNQNVVRGFLRENPVATNAATSDPLSDEAKVPVTGSRIGLSASVTADQEPVLVLVEPPKAAGSKAPLTQSVLRAPPMLASFVVVVIVADLKWFVVVDIPVGLVNTAPAATAAPANTAIQAPGVTGVIAAALATPVLVAPVTTGVASMGVVALTPLKT
jgi:hypothetical protein